MVNIGSAPSTGLIDLLGPFLTALVSGAMVLIGVYLTNRHTAKTVHLQHQRDHARETQSLLRDRGEELYVVTHNWLGGLTGFYMRRNAVMQGKITMADCIDLELKEPGYDITRLEMLIDAYFPHVREAYDIVIEARSRMNSIGIAHDRAYRSGDTEGERFLQPYIQAQIALENAGDALKRKVVESIAAV